MELINQPFNGQLGDLLIKLLESSNYKTLNIIVAFAKNSGVLTIRDAIKSFREQGGVVNVYVGVDLGGTSYEALNTLLLCTDSLNIVHFESGQTFHSKIYQFIGEEEGALIIGSHNLTFGGLWTNIESSVLIPINVENTNKTLIKELESYIKQLTLLGNSFMQVSKKDDIDKLLQNGYISKEIMERAKNSNVNTNNGKNASLFGKSLSVRTPYIPYFKDKAVPASDTVLSRTTSTQKSSDYQSIWFETRKMTGGSRNILDLSKKSLLEYGNPNGTTFDLGEQKFIRGGVEFFGLDPSLEGDTKDITLEFEGVDYAGNTILYPKGAKKNGTWRLQIKGVSSSGRGITEALRAKGEEFYLVEKVVTFTKISNDYYSLSVLPVSELGRLKKASLILARNGANSSARLIGMF